MRIIALGLILMLSTASAAEHAITIDGKPPNAAQIVALSGAPQPTSGDLVRVGGTWLVLGVPGNYHVARRDDGWHWSFADGEWSPLQARIGMRREETADGEVHQRLDNPLAAMSEEQRGRIQHVVFAVNEPLAAEVTATFTGVHWDRVVVSIEALPASGVLPAIPTTIRHLELDPSSSSNAFRLTVIRDFPQLRYLHVGMLDDDDEKIPADFNPLAVLQACPDLVSLELRYQSFGGRPVLPALPAMRFLTIAGCRVGQTDWPQRLEQLAGAPGLRELDCGSDQLTSLAGLATFTHLESLRLPSAPLAELAAIPSSLRRLVCFSARFPDEQRKQLATLHPDLTVLAQWEDALDDLLGSDRILLRTGGTCHRRPENERVLWSSDERQEIDRFLAILHIDDRTSGDHCMCCGSTTVELHRMGEVVASLGFHHGHGLRWAGGPWPGDAVLEPAAREVVASWLSERGDRSIAAELQAAKKADAAFARIRFHWLQVLGDQAMAEANASKSLDEVRAVIQRTPTGDLPATVTALRLYGGAFPSWRVHTGFDRVVAGDGRDDHGLFTTEALAQVLPRLGDDPTARDGACRVLFGWRRLEDVSPKVQSDVLVALARHGLSDPRDDNRCDVVSTLTSNGSPWARALLRECLAGIAPRALPAEAETTPSGSYIAFPQKPPLPDPCDVVAAAALGLIHLREQDALPEVRAAMSRMNAIERTAVLKALGELTDKPAAGK